MGNKPQTPRDDPKLTAYALGELDGEEAAAVERAVGESVPARRTVEEILEASSMLQYELSQEPELFLTEEQRESILKGKVPSRSLDETLPWTVETFPRDEHRFEAERSLRRSRWGSVGIGVAAAVAVLLGVAGLEISGLTGRGSIGNRVSSLLGKGEDKITIGIGGRGDVYGVDSGHGSDARPGSDGHGGIAGVTGSSGLPGDTGSHGVAAPIGVLWPDQVTRSSVAIDYPIPSFEHSLAGDASRETASRRDSFAQGNGNTSLDGRDPLDLVASIPGDGIQPDERRSQEPVLKDKEKGLWLASASSRTISAAGVSLPGRAIPGDWRPIPLQEPGAVAGRGQRASGQQEVPLPFSMPVDAPVSRVPLAYDSAAYGNVRHFLMRHNQLPPREIVSVGDLVNYFDYSYEGPSLSSGSSVAASVEVVECPWNAGHHLARVGLKARESSGLEGAPKEVVLLVDSERSMRGADRLPLFFDAVYAMLDHLAPSGSRVATVGFGGASLVLLPPTPASERQQIAGSLKQIEATVGGSDGRTLPEAVALSRRFVGKKRDVQFVLVTDRLGARSDGGRPLVAEVARLADSTVRDVLVLGVGDTVLGRGWKEAAKTKGVELRFAGSEAEARRALVDVAAGSRRPIVSRETSVAIEFNPAQVRGYRLLDSDADALQLAQGKKQDRFVATLKAGESVTALYELIPAGAAPLASGFTTPLKYARFAREISAGSARDAGADELFTVQVAHDNGKVFKSRDLAVPNEVKSWERASLDLQFAASVAGYGMLLGDFDYTGTLGFEQVIAMGSPAVERGHDPLGLRSEFLELVRVSRNLAEEGR